MSISCSTNIYKQITSVRTFPLIFWGQQRLNYTKWTRKTEGMQTWCDFVYTTKPSLVRVGRCMTTLELEKFNVFLIC